jgi:hypothetical protein
MKVGYCVGIAPHMASYRLRVAIPAPLLGCEYEIGAMGSPSFFYKHAEADLELAQHAGPFVYDVVNDHFAGKLGEHYRTMCGAASRVTCASAAMAEIIGRWTGRNATVIDDPYENEEWLPQVLGNEVLWLGHAANVASLFDVVGRLEGLPILLTVCTNYKHSAALEWSPETERRSLARCAVMLVTGNNPGASSNRIVKALRAGRFVVTPGGAPAWDTFRPYIWVGDVREGIEWAFNNREEACAKIMAGQEFVRERNCPKAIARMWTEVFGSILPPDTSDRRDGLPLT